MAASALGPRVQFERTKERDNFHTLCTLLIDGGTRVLRDVLDYHLPPAELEMELSNPLVRDGLRSRFNKEQWKIVYPSSNSCGKSSDFDICILFRILLFAVFEDGTLNSGLNQLPPEENNSPLADLVRIRFYRNKVYAHIKTTEIGDEDFSTAWNDLRNALIRLEGTISANNADEWREAILNYFESTRVDDPAPRQLQQWYQDDMGSSEVIEVSREQYVNNNEVEPKIYSAHSRNEVAAVENQMGTANYSSTSIMDSTPIPRGPVNCFKSGFATASTSRCAVVGGCCEAMDIPESRPTESFMEEHVVDRSISTVADESIDLAISLGEDCGPPNPPIDPQASAKLQGFIHAVSNGILNTRNSKQQDELVLWLYNEMKVVLTNKRKGCLAIRLRCLSLRDLQGLWEDINGGNKLKDAVEQILLTEEIKSEFGIDKFDLKVKLSVDEYKACRRKLIIRALKRFDLGLIRKIEDLIDNGKLEDGLACIKEVNPAANLGTPATLESLMQGEEVVSCCNKYGQSPLHLVAVRGDSSIAQSLLFRGADASKTDMFGRTPLHIASRYGHLDFVRTLIDCCPGLDLNSQDEFGNTALNHATQKEHIAVGILLERCGAKRTFHVPSLQSLSKRSLTKIQNGYNLVHGLCMEGRHGSIKRLLLTHSIGVDVIDGCRTSRDAPEFRHMSALEIVKALEGEEYHRIATDFEEAMKRYADIPKLHQAVEKCDVDETVALLLDKTAPVSAATENGETALHFAAAIGSPRIMELLISFRADIDSQTSKGETPLMIASALHKNVNVVKLLMDKGANIACQDIIGCTVLHYAAKKGATEILKQLLSGPQRPYLEIRDPYGNTPLHLAVKYGRVEAAEFLIRQGGDTNAHTKQCLRERMYMVQGTSTSGDIWMYVLINKHSLVLWEKTHKSPEGVEISKFGHVLIAGKGKKPPKHIRKYVEESLWLLDENDETPLILAVRSGNQDMARLLITKGAKVGTPDAENLTPLHLVAMKGSKSMAKLLIDERADINASSSSRSPLDLAELNGNSEVELYLRSLTSKEGPLVPNSESGLMKEKAVQMAAAFFEMIKTSFHIALVNSLRKTKTQITHLYNLDSPKAFCPVPRQVLHMVTA